MRDVSLLLTAEDNRLVRLFSNKIYPLLPEDLQRYYNQYFSMRTNEIDLSEEATKDVMKDMLYCEEWTKQPDFETDRTIEAINEVLPDKIRIIEYFQTHPTNPIPEDIISLNEKNNLLIDKYNLPANYYRLENLRAYCEYLKSEAHKPTEEHPESVNDIEPPEYVKEYFEEYPQYFELSKYPIEGKKRYFALVGLGNIKVKKAVKKLCYEWLYNIKTHKPYHHGSIKDQIEVRHGNKKQ